MHCTKHLQNHLVGKDKIEIIGYADASLGTGRNGKSIVAECVALSRSSGSICCKTTATTQVCTSAYESETEGQFRLHKSINKVHNIVTDIGIHEDVDCIALGDNEAVGDFIRGQNQNKNARHMELRLFYLRSMYETGRIIQQFVPGI